MNSNQIKSAIALKLGIRVVVRTIPGKGRKWIEARIRGTMVDDCIYSAGFPEDFRRACLSVVYGEEFAARQSAGGNIGVHSISLYADQWGAVLQK